MDKSLLIAHIDSSKENSTAAVLRLIGSNSSGIGMTNIKQLKMCGNSTFTYPEHARSISQTASAFYIQRSGLAKRLNTIHKLILEYMATVGYAPSLSPFPYNASPWAG